MSSGRRLLLTIGIPIFLVGSIFYGPYIPGFLEGLFDKTVFPFAITYWMGLNFSNMYFFMVQDLEQQRTSRGTIAIMAGALALVFFIAVGGPSVLWRDPWLFGITVMPGVDIAWPAARDWYAKSQSRKTTASALPEPAALASEPIIPPDAG